MQPESEFFPSGVVVQYNHNHDARGKFSNRAEAAASAPVRVAKGVKRAGRAIDHLTPSGKKESGGLAKEEHALGHGVSYHRDTGKNRVHVRLGNRSVRVKGSRWDKRLAQLGGNETATAHHFLRARGYHVYDPGAVRAHAKALGLKPKDTGSLTRQWHLRQARRAETEGKLDEAFKHYYEHQLRASWHKSPATVDDQYAHTALQHLHARHYDQTSRPNIISGLRHGDIRSWESALGVATTVGALAYTEHQRQHKARPEYHPTGMQVWENHPRAELPGSNRMLTGQRYLPAPQSR